MKKKIKKLYSIILMVVAVVIISVGIYMLKNKKESSTIKKENTGGIGNTEVVSIPMYNDGEYELSNVKINYTEGLGTCVTAILINYSKKNIKNTLFKLTLTGTNIDIKSDLYLLVDELKMYEQMNVYLCLDKKLLNANQITIKKVTKEEAK